MTDDLQRLEEGGIAEAELRPMGELSVSVILQGMVELDGELMATGMTVTNLDHLLRILKFQVLEQGKNVSGSISVYDEGSFNTISP